MQAAFAKELEGLKPEEGVFVDQTTIYRGIRLHGRAISGERVCDKVPGKKKKEKENMVGALCGGKIIAPYVFTDGNMNADLFEGWVRTCLVPVLVPGQTVFLDNAPWHKSQEIIDLIEEAGCRVRFFPPYSPNLNPIEKIWGAMKKAIHAFCREIISFSEKINLTVQKYAA